MSSSPYYRSLAHSDGLASCGSDCSLNNKSDYPEYALPSFAEVDPLITSNSWSSDDDVSRENIREPRVLSFSLPRFSLAKLSVFFLAFATLTDMALTKMSSDVERPRASLGSAAISSVTDGNWFGTLQSVASQVQDAFARKEEAAKVHKIPRGGANASSKLSRSTKRTQKHESSISVQQPFVNLDIIAQLTLGEVGETFRYAVQSSDADFNESRFLQELQPRVRKVIQGMQEAVTRSRGDDVIDWVRSSDDTEEGVDAFKFAAAMRVFAEWRLLRQVPEGYKGFALGMSLGHKDVVQNVLKMEEAVHEWLDYQRHLCEEDDSCQPLRTPTLRELLSYEVETGVHPANRLPRLKEKSAGMGLLWVRRQLAYQTQIFDNVLDMERFPSMKDAVGAAYTEVYNKFHGWAVQKIFNYSFQSAPEAEEILRHMNPHRLQELMNEQPRTSSSESDDDFIKSDTTKDENPVEQLLNHIGGEWDKLAFNVVKVFNKNALAPEMQVRGGGESLQALDEDYITQEMVKDAHQQIVAYLQVARPLLQNLATLFDDLNMDDPTRV
jgi:Glycolipid transfer protein (GLTP)